MGYSVNISETAQREVDAIVEYIVTTLKNLSAASRFYKSFMAIKPALEASPNFYPNAFAASQLLGVAVRKISVGNYRVHFVVNEADRQVIVFSVVHVRQSSLQLIQADFQAEK